MEEINDVLKLIAQVVDILRSIDLDLRVEEDVQQSINLLLQCLDKLAHKM